MIRERLGEAIDSALEDDLEGCATTSRGRLALILLLDQLTRERARLRNAALGRETTPEEAAFLAENPSGF